MLTFRSALDNSPLRLWLRLLIGVLLVAGVFVLQSLRGSAQVSVSPPGQPEDGPGGLSADYIVGVAEEHGSMPTGYWLYEPGNPDGTLPAEPMPLVIFFHGYGAIEPEIFRPWIDHIVGRGAIVVFPYYQNSSDLIIPDFVDNSVIAVRDAVDELSEPGHAPVDLNRIGVVGHSVGGVLTANYAAIAAEEDLPISTVIMPVEPGGCVDCNELGSFGPGVPLMDFSKIPSSVKAYIVTGAEDTLVYDYGAKHVWNGMTAVPLEQRDYIIVHSDFHGSPPLFADHGFPEAGPLHDRLDGLDWYGTWKLFDLLTDCGFHDLGCDVAFGGSEAQTGMGAWSDGTPVVPVEVVEDPGD